MKFFHIIIFTLFTSILVGCSSKKGVSSDKRQDNSTSQKKSTSKNDDRAFKALFFSALKEKGLENYDKAISLFQECIKKKPHHAASYHEISLIQKKDGSFISALESAEKAAELEPENKWYLVQLAQMQKKSLQYENVLKSYEKLVKIDPKNLDFLINLSEAYMVNSQPNKAADVINDIENIVGKNDELILQKKSLYLQAGETEKAILEIEKLIESDPTNPKYLNILGQVYEEIGELEKAIEQYKKIVALNPNDGMSSLSLAQYYKNNNQKGLAYNYLVTTFKDENISPSLKLTILMEYTNESLKDDEVKDQTLELIHIMQNTHPKSVKSFVVAGDFYSQHNELNKAREAYLKASKLDNNSYPIWVQLLSIDMQTKNHQNLFDDSKTALELFPAQPAFYLYNGIAAYQLKKYDDAIKTLKSGKDLIINDDALLVDFYRYIGESYHEQKNYREADSFFEKALEVKPNQPYLLNNYSYYLSVRKENLKRAAEMAQKANNILQNEPSFEDTYGWVLFQQEKYTEAEKWIKKALEDGGENSGTILEHYGDVLYFLNKKEKALEYWLKAKENEGYSDKLDQKIKTKQYVE